MPWLPFKQSVTAAFVFHVVSGKRGVYRGRCILREKLSSRFLTGRFLPPFDPRLCETLHAARRNAADRGDRAAIRNTLLRNYSAASGPLRRNASAGLFSRHTQKKNHLFLRGRSTPPPRTNVFSLERRELDGRFRGEKDAADHGRCKRLKNSNARLQFIIIPEATIVLGFNSVGGN